MENEKEYFTTGEASKLLGISFRTLKRWIYKGKIKAEKLPNGRYIISKDEIEKLKYLDEDELSKSILKLVSEKKVAYLRELQVNLEDKYPHYEVYNKLQILVKSKKINTYLFGSSKQKYRWFFPIRTSWEDVKDIANKKMMLAEAYKNHPRRFENNDVIYNDYSEYLVEQSMIRAGYTIVAKDAYYFNGFAYKEEGAGRPKDLDFIVKLPGIDIFLGVEVKNRLDYPKSNDINDIINICRKLQIKPLLVARMVHPMTFDVIKNLGGYVLIFKQMFIKPGFPRDKFEEIRKLKIPIAIYRYPPDFLINKFQKAAKYIVQKNMIQL
jgi:excisionase family DNA binding protein